MHMSNRFTGEVKKAFDKYNRKAVRDTFPDGQEDTAGEYIKINEAVQ